MAVTVIQHQSAGRMIRRQDAFAPQSRMISIQRPVEIAVIRSAASTFCGLALTMLGMYSAPTMGRSCYL